MTIEMKPIGYVASSRSHVEDDNWGGIEATIVLEPEMGLDALQGLDSFSHVEVLFHFDKVDPSTVHTGSRHPRNNTDWPLIGILAQRGKNRPNRIGSTICRVVRCEGHQLVVVELDAIDGTPVLDIKPVMKEFLPREPIVQPAWSTELMSRYWDNSSSNSQE